MRVSRAFLFALLGVAGATAMACQVPNPAYRAGQPLPSPDARIEAPVTAVGGAGGAPAGPPDALVPADLSPQETETPSSTPPDVGGPPEGGSASTDSANHGPDGPGTQDTAPTAGLLAAWAFDKAPAGGGESVLDELGNRATLRGSTGWDTDLPPSTSTGVSMAFPGGDSYVQLTFAQAGALSSTGDKSITFWCKSTDPGTPTRTLIALYNQNKTASVGLQIGIGENKIEAWPYGLNFRNLSFTTTTPRAWHHVAYTFAAGKHVLYVDGAEVDTSTTWAPKAGALNVARLGTTDETATPANFYLGYMRDLRIYGRALDAAEVRSLAARL